MSFTVSDGSSGGGGTVDRSCRTGDRRSRRGLVMLVVIVIVIVVVVAVAVAVVVVAVAVVVVAVKSALF